MSRYALIDTSSNLVVNSIVLDEQADWPFTDGFMVVRTDVASIGWSYDDGIFSPPPIVPPTREEIISANQTKQSELLASASMYLAQVAVKINFADPFDQGMNSLKEWQTYCHELQAVDISSADVIWPSEPVKIS